MRTHTIDIEAAIGTLKRLTIDNFIDRLVVVRASACRGRSDSEDLVRCHSSAILPIRFLLH